MGSIDIPPKFIPVPPKPRRSITERIADAIESVQLYAARKIFIDAQLAERGGVPRIKFKDTLVPVMYADRDGFLQPLGWEGWDAWMNVTFTQTNVAGGAIAVDISPGLGNEFIVEQGFTLNSGTNGTKVFRNDGSNQADPLINNIASAASTASAFPQANSLAGSATLLIDSTPTETRRVAGIQSLTLTQTAAGAQNDTFQIIIYIRLKHKSQLPTVSIARSTNAGSVTGSGAFAVVE